MYQRPSEPAIEPAVTSEQKTCRVSLVFDQASGKSRIVKRTVRSRAIDPARLPSGTWAVIFRDRLHVGINDLKITGPVQNPSPLTLIAQRLFEGHEFSSRLKEVADALKHDGVRPVAQLPADAYRFDSEDLSGQYRIVHKGMRVINTKGELLWPPSNDI